MEKRKKSMKNNNAHDGRGMRDYKNKFFQTLSEKLSQEIPEVSLAALSLELSKVSELKIKIFSKNSSFLK